jgi:hypothetical protein
VQREFVNQVGTGGPKKFGVGNGDPSLRSQPRLPGSVVGEASMDEARRSGKITQVTVP